MDFMRVWLFRIALLSAVAATALATFSDAAEHSLRFYGHGVGDIDRVKIRIDDPSNTLPGPPADIGAEDFTIEFRLKSLPGDNQTSAIGCGVGIDWIYGNIIIDRDRYNQDRKFGVSIADGRLAFGMSGDGTGDYTICGTIDVRDGSWHHVAVERRRSDGWMWLFVDGTLEAQIDGPDGDVSYPDDGVPGDYCGGPCVNSDPYLVIAAEKHDAGEAYPSFSGWLDEIRLSNVLRYSTSFVPPGTPFVSDANTVALYPLNEGTGTVAGDSSGASGGPSHGTIRFGGSPPPGPVWSTQSPFSPGTGIEHEPPSVTLLGVAPNPFTEATEIRYDVHSGGQVSLVVYDIAGRRVRSLLHSIVPVGMHALFWDGRDEQRRTVAAGVYFVRLTAEGLTTTKKVTLLR
jgi:hypothetical protein